MSNEDILRTNVMVEQILYDIIIYKILNIQTEGRFSEIYTAIWIDEKYDEWDSKK